MISEGPDDSKEKEALLKALEEAQEAVRRKLEEERQKETEE
jgi:hypothetical protein